jgi:hypothetical protein
MGYDREKIFEKAKKVIEKKKLFFIEDVVSLLPISKSTFYDYFKVDSDELNTIKDLLDNNRVELKVGMRSKWYKSDNATLQISLMKLICTTDERKKLAMTYNETEIKPVGDVSVSFVNFSDKNKESEDDAI